MQNLRDIAFEEIVPGYSWGQYGDFRVIIQMDSGYVNATRLCDLAATKYGKAKKFKHWKHSGPGKDLIACIADAVGASTASLLREEQSRIADVIRGTYVHPDLLPHVATWASVDFAIKVSRIVNAHLIHQATAAKDSTIRDLRAEIEELKALARNTMQQNNEILDAARALRTDNIEIKAELQETNTKLNDANTELGDTRADLATTHARLEETHGRLVETHDRLAETQETVIAIATKLNVAVERRVPPAVRRGKEEVVAIYAKKRPFPSASDEMMVTRCQECNLAKQVAALAAKGYIELVVKVAPTPNACALWNQMSKKLTSEVSKDRLARVYKVDGNYFKLRTIGEGAYGREGIAKMLLDMDAEKRNV